MRNLLPIGQFSQICHLSTRILRHYDEIGLLKPALIDPETGYRYYSITQTIDAEKIRLLRSLDISLENIRAIINETDIEKINEYLNEYKQVVKNRINKYYEILDFLEELINKKETKFMNYDVKTKHVEAQLVASIRIMTSQKTAQQDYRKAQKELFSNLEGNSQNIAGPYFIIYHGEEFDENNMDMELCFPIKEGFNTNGNVSCRKLQGTKVAYTLHKGSYEKLNLAYKSLIEWINNNNHKISGSPREIYLTDPRIIEKVDEYRTEVAFPIN